MCFEEDGVANDEVAIHNKNGKGLLPVQTERALKLNVLSQSTIKMEKGYYTFSFDAGDTVITGRNPQ